MRLHLSKNVISDSEKIRITVMPMQIAAVTFPSPVFPWRCFRGPISGKRISSFSPSLPLTSCFWRGINSSPLQTLILFPSLRSFSPEWLIFERWALFYFFSWLSFLFSFFCLSFYSFFPLPFPLHFPWDESVFGDAFRRKNIEGRHSTDALLFCSTVLIT